MSSAKQAMRVLQPVHFTARAINMYFYFVHTCAQNMYTESDLWRPLLEYHWLRRSFWNFCKVYNLWTYGELNYPFVPVNSLF